MKKIIIIILLVILNSLGTLAADTENLNYYDSIDVNITIGSNINIIPKSGNYLTEDFNAELNIFPRPASSEFQTIKSVNILSSPRSSVSVNEDSVSYKWSSPQEKKLSYSYNADINSRLKFQEIKEKVRFPVKQGSLPDDVIEFTRPTGIIQSEDPEIIRLANQIAEGSDDLYDVVFKISKWTNTNINYSLETLTAELQQNSVWVLQNKKGVCDELTVLTIAMLRSLGIPTKFVSGSSYTDVIGDFGSHAWLEVYFPKYGWIQFDPTYGQYGFVDSTHIKYRSSKDAKESAVNYAWRSRDAEVTPEKLNINVSVKSKGEKIKPLLDLKIKPLKDKISGGSFVPLEISVENTNNFYVPATIYITKAPSQLFNNKIELLLKPSQAKSEYFIVKVPDDIKQGFTYTSTIEIADFFGSKADTEVEFSKIYESYSENKAEELVNSLTEEEQKVYSRDVDLTCKGKKLYYKYEDAGVITCNIQNNGNTNLDDIKVCLEKNCKNINIPISRSKEINFTFSLKTSKDLQIIAENSEILKHSFLSIKVIENPNLTIKKITYPNLVSYKQEGEILFTLKTDAVISDLTVDVDNKNVFNMDKFHDEGEFKIPFEGSYFFNKESKLKIKYKDENGKNYYMEKQIIMEVTEVPVYQKIIAKIKNLFR